MPCSRRRLRCQRPGKPIGRNEVEVTVGWDLCLMGGASGGLPLHRTVRCGEGKKSNKFATEMNGETGRSGGGRGECRSVGSKGRGIKSKGNCSNNHDNNNGEG
jgi:hypothetical protein